MKPGSVLRYIPKKIEKSVPDNDLMGEMARDFRETRGLSLREMARRMHISAVHLSYLERGKRNWSWRLVERWNVAVDGRKT